MCVQNRSGGVLFYSIRPSAGPATPLTGATVEDDLPVQTGDEALLGQIDGVESGEVTGWACLRGYMAKPLEVRCSSALKLVLHMLLHQCFRLCLLFKERCFSALYARADSEPLEF